MKEDYSLFDRLELAAAPVGVKYDFFRPEDMQPLNDRQEHSLCELLRLAQSSERPFYVSKDDAQSCVGKKILGMEPWAPFEKSGQIGVGLGVFDQSRCNARLYKYVQNLPEGTVNYVRFARVDQMAFQPDVLIVAAPPEKAELVLRAASYSTGELYQSICTPTIGCSWLFAYPYNEDKINFILPAFVHGMHGRKLFSADTVLISIPYRWIPAVLRGLEQMSLHLEGHNGVAAYHREFDGLCASLEEKARRQKLLE